jgi:hypothetical protein
MRKFGIAGFIGKILAEMLGGLVVTAAILISPTGICANDSPARLGIGGITFTKNKQIRMLEEVLEISTKKIRVTYRFLNESDKDIDTTVAFPLPPYGAAAAPLEGPPSEPNPSFLLGKFRSLVNGRSVATQVERKAVVGEQDVTDRLRGLGLSDERIFSFDPTPGQLSALERLGGEKKGLLESNVPGWKIAETAFWQQTFPSRKEIVIEHDYEPIVGETGNKPYQKGFGYFDLPTAYYGESLRDVCLDDITRRAIENRIRPYADKDETVSVDLKHVEYILGTGRNWKGPIGQFTLRIEKENPDQLISLCFPGKPIKVSPTVYEFRQMDFVPPDRLVVYLYTIHSEQASEPVFKNSASRP